MATIKRTTHIAGEDIYVDADGKRVKAGSPDAAVKIVAKGSEITPKVAQKYNLKEALPDEPEKKSKAKADDDVEEVAHPSKSKK